MNIQSKSSSILASVMVMILAVPGAWAGEGRYDHGGHDHGYPKKGQYNSHYNTHYNNHYNNYYRGGRYYYPPYQRYKSCSHSNGHHNHNNNTNETLWIGLLGGGIVGYPLGNIHSGY